MTLVPNFELNVLLGSNFSDLETLVPGQLQGFPLGVLALEGNDTIVGSVDNERINGNQGDDLIQAGSGIDMIFGGRDNDFLEGQAGGDLIFGNLGQDILNGGDDSDDIFGGQNNDQLFGDAGDDVLSGDLGLDTLTGGAGADRFVTQPSSSEPDLITDFQDGIDLIQLPAGLGFESLELTAQADDRVLITLATTQEQLVILEGITPSEITETDIITSFERTVEKLSSIPVFVVTDAAGFIVTSTSPSGVDTTNIFIEPEDARAFFDQITFSDPDLAAVAEVRSVSLGEVYQQSRSESTDVEFAYLRDNQQVENAEMLIGGNFTGVPIFFGINSAGFITRVQDNQTAFPVFFSLEDLEEFLEMYKQVRPSLADSVEIQVSSLENFITASETIDDLAVSLSTLVPSRETLEFVQGLEA